MMGSFLEEVLAELYLKGCVSQERAEGNSSQHYQQEQKYGGKKEWGVQDVPNI